MTPHPARPGPGELAHAAWFKSTASNGSEGCVEVAHLEHWTAVRDSKNPAGPIHRYTPRQWARFLDRTRAGEFDHT